MTFSDVTRPNAGWRRTALAVAAALALPGCAGLSPDGGMGPVRTLTEARTGHTLDAQRSDADLAAAQSRSAELLKQPPTPDTAVQLAFINHRGLQARLAELGVADAERALAGSWRGPSLSLGRLTGGGVTELDRALLVDVAALFTLPAARQQGERRLALAQLRAAGDAVALAADVRMAWFHAVAAQELLVYQRQVLGAAEAASELALRMQAAGNFSKLQRMREQSFHADATSGVARAEQLAVAARERLLRLVGLGANPQLLTLPERLPELPAEPWAPPDLAATALSQRLDVLLARQTAQALDSEAGLAASTRLLGGVQAGVQDQRSTGEPTRRGVELSVELPRWDGGNPRVAAAQARALQARHQAADVADAALTEVRTAATAYRTAYDLARHYRDEVVPLRKRISEEQLLRYNGMLSSVFELLADARDQVNAVTGQVQALRELWIADTQLRAALTGRGLGDAAAMPLSDLTAGSAPAVPTNAGPAH